MKTVGLSISGVASLSTSHVDIFASDENLVKFNNFQKGTVRLSNDFASHLNTLKRETDQLITMTINIYSVRINISQLINEKPTPDITSNSFSGVRSPRCLVMLIMWSL